MDNDKLMTIKQELQNKCVFAVDHRIGANHVVPDPLNRIPVKDPERKKTG